MEGTWIVPGGRKALFPRSTARVDAVQLDPVDRETRACRVLGVAPRSRSFPNTRQRGIMVVLRLLVSLFCVVGLGSCSSRSSAPDSGGSADGSGSGDAGSSAGTADDSGDGGGSGSQSGGEGTGSGPLDLESDGSAGDGCGGCSLPPMCGAPPDVCSCGCLAGEFETCGGDGHSFWVEGCSETESCIEWEMCEGACHEVGGRSLCTRDLPTCEDVQRVYEAAVDPMAQACGDDGECVVLEGHCGIGLGGCHHAVTALYEEPGFLRQTLLDALSKRWIELACTGAVCDCAEPPSDATCVTGLCTATP